MVFIACGINHLSASLDIREQAALSVEKQNHLSNMLLTTKVASEVLVLSTCNRTEIYCEVEDFESLPSLLAEFNQFSLETVRSHFYFYEGKQGIRHLLRVASGLDSMMLGEPQILGQLKRSYEQACQSGSIKEKLSKLFPYVFQSSKRIRNGSGIGKNPVSVAFAAVQLMTQKFPAMAELTVLIIGSGETSTLVAKYLYQQGVRKFIIASRTEENAKQLAQKFNGIPVSIMAINRYLSQADIVVSATACPLPFIDQALIKATLNQRNSSPMFLLDLAVPRDIEKEVGEFPEITLFNIDDLQQIVEKGMAERRLAAEKAEILVDEEVDNYLRWHRTLRAKQVICDYRSQMKHLAGLELQRALQKLDAGHCHKSVLEEFSTRLVNKLTHSPTIGLREAAQNNRVELLDFAKHIFQGNHSSYEEVT